MNDLELALARARLYSLLAELFSNGVTKENLELIGSTSELASELPQPFDADALAAVHYEIFEHQVPPYESLFLDRSGLIGGRIADDIQQMFDHIGYENRTGDRSCDHISELFRALSKLCRREFEARRRDNEEVLRRARGGMQRIFFEHTLLWIHCLAIAVMEQSDRFFTQLMVLAVELVESHAAELPNVNFDGSLNRGEVEEGHATDSDTAEVTLAYLTEHLTRATNCGFYLTRSLIGELGRRLDLPRGFASRQQMLQNLFEVAIKFDRRSALIAAIDSYCESVVKYYASRMDAVPCLKSCLSGRIESVNHSRKLLKRFEVEIDAQ